MMIYSINAKHYALWGKGKSILRAHLHS
uniref:Uncharacterized protein n=1 Tax=Anguilla anguilla TaxID=7936 RepID=A0A0E9XVC4_ANGAN